jgi:hypothetical protein
MTELRIEQYGDGLALYLARITKDQWLRFERACAGWFGVYRKATLHRKWYGADNDFRRIFGVHDWRQLYAGDHRYYGPLLRSRAETEDFFDATTLHLDGEEIRLDPRRVTLRFHKALAPPKLGGDHIVVCHGEGYRGYTHYALRIDEAFDPGALSFDFLPCGENGYVLQRLHYADAVLTASDEPNRRAVLQIQVMTAPE